MKPRKSAINTDLFAADLHHQKLGQLKSTSADWQPYRFYGTSSAGRWRAPSADGWPHVLSHRSHAADPGIEGLYNLSDEQLSDDGNCCNFCRMNQTVAFSKTL